jgi:hypothetical protein
MNIKIFQWMIIAFICLMWWYHILNTFFVFWQWIISPYFFALGKELIWAMIVAYGVRLWRNHLVFFIKEYHRILILFASFVCWSIGLSLILGKSWYDIILWLKYMLLFFAIVFSAFFCGFVVASYRTDRSFDRHLQNILLRGRQIFFFFAIILIGWIIVQLWKMLFPLFFINYLGYWFIGDFVFGEHPPLYYRTGAGGRPRFSWLFSGPNNFVYFFIAFVPLVIVIIRHHIWVILNRRQIIVVNFVLIVVSLATFSRSLVVSFFVQWLFLFKEFIVLYRRYVTVWSVVFVVWFLLLSLMRFESTREHIIAKMSWIIDVIANVWWYGLGSSWPAIHHGWQFLPENMYLQVLLDTGVVGFWLWVLLIVGWMRCVYRLIVWFRDSHANQWSHLLQWFVVGFFGLLITWLFLHVFEDSMVNYLFFIPFWFFVWYFHYIFLKNKQ